MLGAGPAHDQARETDRQRAPLLGRLERGAASAAGSGYRAQEARREGEMAAHSKKEKEGKEKEKGKKIFPN